MEIYNRIALNCLLLVAGQAALKEKDTKKGALRPALHLILGLGVYLAGRVARINTGPLVVGFSCSIISKSLLQQFHNAPSYVKSYIFQAPIIITAALTSSRFGANHF